MRSHSKLICMPRRTFSIDQSIFAWIPAAPSFHSLELIGRVGDGTLFRSFTSGRFALGSQKFRPPNFEINKQRYQQR